MSTIAVGSLAAVFQDLLGADGGRYGLESFDQASVLTLVFVANGCPTVRALEPWFIDFERTYRPRGVGLVFVNANNAALSPPDAYPRMVERARASGFAFPYLKDEGGRVAATLGAQTTPHAFVLDRAREVRYRGRVADSRQASSITEPYLQRAVDDLLADREVATPETDPYGCAIVW